MVHIVPGWNGGGYETNMCRKICVEKYVVEEYVVEEYVVGKYVVGDFRKKKRKNLEERV